jgi:hypothetical protein
MINTRLLVVLGVAFLAIFAVWIPFAISYTGSFIDCSPEVGCSRGAPIETTIVIILIPGVVLVGIFMAIWLNRGTAESVPGS